MTNGNLIRVQGHLIYTNRRTLAFYERILWNNPKDIEAIPMFINGQNKIMFNGNYRFYVRLPTW